MPHCGPCCAPHLLTILFISLSLSLQHQQHPSNENDFLVCTRRRVLWPLNRDRDGVCMRPVSVLVRSNKIMETPQKEKEDERMMMIFLFSQVLAFRPALIYLCVCVCFFFHCCGSAFFFLPPLPSSIGTKFRRPPVDSHPHHHPFKIRLRPSPKRKTPERERERERKRNIKRTCVCFVFRVWGIQILSQKVFLLLSLSFSPHLFNLL